MISVRTAKEQIQKSIELPQPVVLPLLQAAGLVLAENSYAPLDIPQFQQSSMDGYAFHFGAHTTALQIRGEMAAGTTLQQAIRQNEAVRIFTGAPLPHGADTVVMQEKTAVQDGVLKILDEQLQQGTNVRSVGAEIKKGALAIEKGTILTPAAIGFLAGIGIAEVPVYAAPKVRIVVTGNELQTPGNDLKAGQVYESNSYLLRAALQQAGIATIQVQQGFDEHGLLKKLVADALQQSDMVVVTGGVSVGDYDFVVGAATACGVTQVFHKVVQRPGKPLYFGTKEKKLVFGLPGNPASVLTCFYEYVLPAVKQWMGHEKSLTIIHAPLATAYKKIPQLTHFLKGHYDGKTATPLQAQESFRLSSFAQANCLICLDAEKELYAAGEVVAVHLLPE